MKKLLIVLIVLMSCMNVMAQRYGPVIVFPEDSAGNTVATRTFSITKEEADTSQIFDCWSDMSWCGWAADTTADDSVDLDVSFQMSVNLSTKFSDLFSAWKTVETWTVTAESTVVKEHITDNSVPQESKGRYIVKGSTANSYRIPSLFRIIHENKKTSRW